MKVMLVTEYRDGKLLDSSLELAAFAEELKAESAFLLIGDGEARKQLPGKVYFADAAGRPEYNPDLHKRLALDAAGRESADYIVFPHSSYGWDLAPRVAAALKAAQISEITAVRDGKFELPCLNGKMRRLVSPKTAKAVLTIQSGAFAPKEAAAAKEDGGGDTILMDIPETHSSISFKGYEPPEKKEADLTKAEIIVSAGRGTGKKENLGIILNLAKALHAEIGASRPVVDAGWLDHSRQIGATGQIVSPKLYVACGISGAIQHLTGMKKSNFIVAINKDREAPIAEVADVLVVADLIPFANALAARLSAAKDG